MKKSKIVFKAGRVSPLFLLFLLLAAPLLCGWGRDGHELVSRRAIAQLPAPLAARLADEKMLNAIIAHSSDPDHDVAALSEKLRTADAALKASPGDPKLSAAVEAARAAWQATRSKHFFDLDALTDLPPPFDRFPHDRPAAELAAAEYLVAHDRSEAAALLRLHGESELPAQLDTATLRKLGAALLEKHGTLPWTINEQVAAVSAAMKQDDPARLAVAIAVLSHYVGDLHQPFHTTRNFDGQLTGNHGIHLVIDDNLIRRNRDYYTDWPTAYDRPCQNVPDVLTAVFAQVGRNAALTTRLIAADTEARRQSGATALDFDWGRQRYRRSFSWLDNLLERKDFAGLDPHEVRLLKETDDLQVLVVADDDLVRRQLAAASSMTASLIYTAWLRADRPGLDATADSAAAATTPPTAPQQPEHKNNPLIGVFMAAGAVFLFIVLRRRHLRSK